MNVSPLVRSKLAWRNCFVNIGGAILPALYAIWLFFNGPHNLMHLLPGIAAAIISAYYFIEIIGRERWAIEGNRMQVQWLWGQVKNEIHLSEISSWSEIERRAWQYKCHTLIIHTGSQSFKLNSWCYSNYYPIRALLCTGRPRNLNLQSKQYGQLYRKQHILTFCVSAILLILGSAFVSYNSPPQVWTGCLLMLCGILVLAIACFQLHFKSLDGQPPAPPQAVLLPL